MLPPGGGRGDNVPAAPFAFELSFMSAAAVFAALTLTVAAQPTQTPPPAEAPVTELEGVEVIGRPLQEQVDRFVESVAAPPAGRTLARWNAPVCVGVIAMSPRYAQAMIDRVSTLAVDMGLAVGDPGCEPNVLIVATAEADEVAARSVDGNRRDFRPGTGGTDLGGDALTAFTESDAPVRWWHVSIPRNVDTGEAAVRLRGEEARTNVVRDASRLRANVRDDMERVLIILDMKSIGVVSFGALSDYVGMVALAQIEPNVDMAGFDSVLNLFDRDNAPRALTGWDRDYLRALYASSSDRARSSQQVREIASTMARSRLEAQEAPVEQTPAPSPVPPPSE